MIIVLQEIQDWLFSEEDEHLEFKEAKKPVRLRYFGEVTESSLFNAL